MTPNRSQELLPETSRHLEYSLALAEIAKALTSNLNLTDVLGIIMKSVSQLTRPKNWSLMLVDKDRNELYFEIVVGDAADKIRDLRLPIGEGIAGWVAKRGEAVVVADVSQDPRFTKKMDKASKFQTSSIVCAPLVVRSEVIGVIQLVKEVDDPQPYSDLDMQLLKPFADFAAIAIDNARSFQRVQELTLRDEWTGLHNARFLQGCLDDEVARARRYGASLSVVFMDLDHFKEVNDVHGHAIGSRLLREFGRVIEGLMRQTDKAIRYGGDEFVVVLPATPKAGGLRFAERLRRELDQNGFSGLTDQPIKATVSLGVASFPEDGRSGGQLLEAADRAMYAAKNGGRNTVVDASTT